MDLTFNRDTNTIRYPDGIEEYITTHLTRKERFETLKAIQHELERLKILCQNPGCCSEEEFCKIKEEVRLSVNRLWFKVL